VLGVLDTPFGAYPRGTPQPAGERQLVIADIPGLIEGASEGAGLGHDFLAHVERTRLLVHVLDLVPELSAGEEADIVSNHATIERELATHDERLARLPRVLVLSKADLVPEQHVAAAIAQWSERLGAGVPVIATSSATGAGVGELAVELLRRTPELAPAESVLRPDAGVSAGERASEGETELAEHMVFRPAAASGFVVERAADGSFAVKGRGVERLLARYDVDNEDAMAYLEGRLRKIGVLSALEAEGFQAGDDLEIAGVAFELDPDSPA